MDTPSIFVVFQNPVVVDESQIQIPNEYVPCPEHSLRTPSKSSIQIFEQYGGSWGVCSGS